MNVPLLLIKFILCDDNTIKNNTMTIDAYKLIGKRNLFHSDKKNCQVTQSTRMRSNNSFKGETVHFRLEVLTPDSRLYIF